jgi:hypothetical protein
MTAHFDKHARFAFVAACVVLLAGGMGFRWAVAALNIYLQKEPVEPRASFDAISRTIGHWQAVGKDVEMDEAMLEELGTRRYLDRSYALDGNPRQGVLHLHLAYYTGMIDTVPHVPDRCIVAAGFNKKTEPENVPLQLDTSQWHDDPEYINLATGRKYSIVEVRDAFIGTQSVRMPIGDFKLRTTRFERDKQPNLQLFAGYFFIANGRITPSPDDVRLLAFRPSEKYAYYCKVQFTYGANGMTQDKFVALVAEFLKDFLPELMQKLPDWKDIERQDPHAKPAGSGV